jgi:hypothetical protein
MQRVTTPTHRFTLPMDTSECAEIQLTYKQGDTKLVKHYQDGILPEGMTLDGATVIQTLTQQETKAFKKGRAYAQIRVLTTAGKVYGSQEFRVKVTSSLNEDILA